MDYDDPHLTSNEKTQPIKWTKQPTDALVVIGSLWLDCPKYVMSFNWSFILCKIN